MDSRCPLSQEQWQHHSQATCPSGGSFQIILYLCQCQAVAESREQNCPPGQAYDTSPLSLCSHPGSWRSGAGKEPLIVPIHQPHSPIFPYVLVDRCWSLASYMLSRGNNFHDSTISEYGADRKRKKKDGRNYWSQPWARLLIFFPKY